MSGSEHEGRNGEDLLSERRLGARMGISPHCNTGRRGGARLSSRPESPGLGPPSARPLLPTPQEYVRGFPMCADLRSNPWCEDRFLYECPPQDARAPQVDTRSAQCIRASGLPDMCALPEYSQARRAAPQSSETVCKMIRASSMIVHVLRSQIVLCELSSAETCVFSQSPSRRVCLRVSCAVPYSCHDIECSMPHTIPFLCPLDGTM